jgi:uncharacterized protein DUF4132
MLYQRLVTETRRDDDLDDVRLGAIEKVRWLFDLLDRQRQNWTESLACRDMKQYEELSAAARVLRVEIRKRLRACGDDERRAAAVTLMLAADFTDTLWDYRGELALVVPGTEGWSAAEVAVLLIESGTREMEFWRAESLGFALTAADTLGAAGLRAAEPWLQDAHKGLRDIGAGHGNVLARRIRRLLAQVDPARIPAGVMPPDVPWAAPLRALVTGRPAPEVTDLVTHVAALSGPRPTRSWRRRCLALVKAAGAEKMPTRCLHVLAEGDPLCSRDHGSHTPWLDGVHHHYLVHTSDSDLARGLVWAAAVVGGAGVVSDLAALARRAGGPGRDVAEDLKLAGAAINALGDSDSPAALEALWRLQRMIRHRGLRKQLDAALQAAAGRQGITPGQLIERSVPGHGLAADGSLTRRLGDHRAVVTIEDAATVQVTFTLPDGRRVRTVPAAIKEPYAGEIKELKSRAKEIRGTLSAERARVESLMAADRDWTYEEWGRYYRDHPISGAIATRMIWEFANPGEDWSAAIPVAADLVRADGTEAPVPAADARVRLWHPARATTEEILAWRAFVTGRPVRQPFKQAFREIYPLTPAELETRVYSNRFAAHVVHYGRLYALFKERGWRANFLGRHDGGYHGEAYGTFAEGEWRACFHHDNADEDALDHPDYAATDQVRFERRAGRGWDAVPLAGVPPLVFSEAMRDVDLFVGVTSIAADPTWTDRGEDRHVDYWERASFGELTAGAEVRRDALERILPRTKIADRCSVAGRYLTVRGDLRTYKIHLGSANILMEPDDSYLCIVPDRRGGRGGSGGGGKVYLPFEDERLSLILSKAFLLAADTKITDESILHQIKRGA